MDRPLVVLAAHVAASAGPPHLVEVAGVRVTGGEIADHFATLVAPSIAVAPEATALHGIDDEAVRTAPQAPDALAALLDWLGDDWAAAHEARTLAGRLGFEAARHGLALPASPLVDVRALASRVLSDAPAHDLRSLADWLELEADELGRALPDAATTWKVLEACVERLGGAASGAELLARSGLPLSLASGVPGRPRRFPRRLRPLERACASGEPVTLIYGDDEHEAPARLPVRPRLLYELGDHGYLEAECGLSGTLKTYRLDRVARVEA